MIFNEIDATNADVKAEITHKGEILIKVKAGENDIHVYLDDVQADMLQGMMKVILQAKGYNFPDSEEFDGHLQDLWDEVKRLKKVS